MMSRARDRLEGDGSNGRSRARNRSRGELLGFLVDPSDRHVTHVLLQEGHLWGRKEVAIPISAVTAVNEGIRLSLTKKQVEDLPLR
jgi:hypothetical protein